MKSVVPPILKNLPGNIAIGDTGPPGFPGLRGPAGDYGPAGAPGYDGLPGDKVN